MASAALQLAQIAPLLEHDALLAKMQDELRYSPVKHIHEDGSFDIEHRLDPYYLNNDKWDVEHFLQFEQFADQRDTRWRKQQSYYCYFNFSDPSLNLETKYILHRLTFSDEWSLSATFTLRRAAINRLAKFINEYHPEITSYSQMQEKGFLAEYADYLTDLGLITEYSDRGGKKCKSNNFAIPSIMYNHLQRLVRKDYFIELTTDLWTEDVWDIQYFYKYGIQAPQTATRCIVFTEIVSPVFKSVLKKYLKEKLLTGSIKWSTAHGRSVAIKRFLNYISEKHPQWKDLHNLTRADMMAYYEYLCLYINDETRVKRRDANPKHYPKSMLSQIRTFLDELQIMEYPEAPKTPATQLVRRDDTKGYTGHVSEQIKYIPNSVLQQFFDHIADFPEKYLPVVLTMYYTGLRVSDALELKTNCLVKIDGQYWVETYVWKTDTLDHRCPITEEFANVLQKYINEAEQLSNDDNNPEKYIFVNYRGIRKGMVYSSHALTAALNDFAKRNNIVDENGRIYHFKNHAFRHTFSVKMINNGADILTVMQLLAHATPKMTLVYAKLLDDTKRRSFEEAMKSGVFTFEPSSSERIIYNSDIPQDILDNLWQAHKLNAIDTPYGTCLQRKRGKCGFAKNPPCLTCNNGEPCKDLCVGVFEGDCDKYDILIESTKKMKNMAHVHNRPDMEQENAELLGVLQKIKDVIDGGGMIYGRMDRLRGEANE